MNFKIQEGLDSATSKKGLEIDSVLMMERIEEVEMMCARDNPIYEQISCFSIALYILGCFDAEDIMSVHDFDDCEAAEFLKENFMEISKTDIAPGYKITKYEEKYLLVLGDPVFPKHFAVIVDMESKSPFFSKLRYFGTGYDSLEELINEYLDDDVTGYEDAHYFKLI